MITELKMTILSLKLLLIHHPKSVVHVSASGNKSRDLFSLYLISLRAKDGSVIHANQRRRDGSKTTYVSAIVCIFLVWGAKCHKPFFMDRMASVLRNLSNGSILY